jgi:hypothetical protein
MGRMSSGYLPRLTKEVAEDVVGDGPAEGDGLVVGGLIDFLVVERAVIARGSAWRRVWEFGATGTYGHGGVGRVQEA